METRHTSCNEAKCNSPQSAFEPEDVLEDDLGMLDLGRLRGPDGVITGGKSAGSVEGKECAGKGEKQGAEEEREGVGEEIGGRGEERRERGLGA